MQAIAKVASPAAAAAAEFLRNDSRHVHVIFFHSTFLYTTIVRFYLLGDHDFALQCRVRMTNNARVPLLSSLFIGKRDPASIVNETEEDEIIRERRAGK